MPHHVPVFPKVRQAFGMDINSQEFCQATGMSLVEGCLPDVVRGDWSNNWVVYADGEGEENL